MTGTSQAHVMYVLDCKHVVMSAPYLIPKQRKLRCPICDAEKTIGGVHRYEWRAYCVTCRYTRWCGTSEILANQLANSHHRTMRFHKVEAEYAVNPTALSELVRLRKMKEL